MLAQVIETGRQQFDHHRLADMVAGLEFERLVQRRVDGEHAIGADLGLGGVLRHLRVDARDERADIVRMDRADDAVLRYEFASVLGVHAGGATARDDDAVAIDAGDYLTAIVLE